MKKFIYGILVTTLCMETSIYGSDDATNPCPAELRVSDLENLSKSGAIQNPKNKGEDLVLKSVDLSPEIQSKYNKEKTSADTNQHKLMAMLPKSWQVLSRGVVTKGRAKAEREFMSNDEGKTECHYKFADLFDKTARRADSHFTVEIKQH